MARDKGSYRRASDIHSKESQALEMPKKSAAVSGQISRCPRRDLDHTLDCGGSLWSHRLPFGDAAGWAREPFFSLETPSSITSNLVVA